MKHLIKCIVLCLSSAVISCGSSIKLWNGGDLTPPEIESIKVKDSRSIVIQYKEEILNSDYKVSISEDIAVSDIIFYTKSIELKSDKELQAGKEYILTIFMFDLNKNSSLYVEKIYGLNPNPATLLINEFTCEGSSSNPDKVELKVLEEGSLAGLSFQHGALKNFSKRFFFPPINVTKGDYIVLHLAPSLDFPFDNETKSKTESTHPQAYSTAWDFFVSNDEHRGLSNTNASISVVDLTRNSIMDAVIFSSREDDPQHSYRGFYRANILAWAEEIVENENWYIQDSSIGVLPSDGINPLDSSTTRSISRDSMSTDSNSKLDWHITPTKKSSFGESNSDEVYTK